MRHQTSAKDRRPRAAVRFCIFALRPLALAALAALAAGAAPSPGAALVIYESANAGASGQTDGVEIRAQQFVGAGFALSERMHVSSIGGFVVRGRSGTDIFAALAPMSAALPGFAPLDLATNALAATLLDLPTGAQDVAGAVDVILEPGDYALILGSGLFGATGTGYLPESDPAFASAAFFFANTGVGVWSTGGFDDARFFVIGEPAPLPPDPETPPPETPGRAAVPLPGALPLAGVGAACLALMGWRRRRG